MCDLRVWPEGISLYSLLKERREEEQPDNSELDLDWAMIEWLAERGLVVRPMAGNSFGKNL